MSTDTRTIKRGDLFIALRGPSFDGNKYAEAALEKGARYALVDDHSLSEHPNFIFTKNCLSTLQELASYRRKRMQVPVLGITGSNGKTTTKELLVEVLSNKFVVSATKGNYNNHIGVPLTLLNAKKDADFLIVEMGTNQPGDIQQLCDFADPTLGLITNIGASHLEKLGSTEGVFKDKSSLYHYVVKNKGVFFINSGDRFLSKLEADSVKTVTYSSNFGKFGKLYEVVDTNHSGYLSIRLVTETDSKIVSTRMSGNYNMENVAAALAVGSHFDISLETMTKAIESYCPDNMRSQVMQTDRNSIIMDAYNANPTSMRVSIESFSKGAGSLERFFILGDMLELGASATSEHQQILDLLSQLKMDDKVLLIGKIFSSLDQDLFPTFVNTEELIKSDLLKKMNNKTILIKGSRGIRLERVVDHL